MKAKGSAPLVFNKITAPVQGKADKIRQAQAKQHLLESGGKRVSVNLSGQAVKDIEHIKNRDGVDATAAIIAALAAHAKR